MLKKYFKNYVFDSLSLLGVFLLILGVYFSFDTVVKSIDNASQKMMRDKVTGSILSASEVKTKKRHGTHGNGIIRYLQSFKISYKYKGKEYKVTYKNFNLGKPNGYFKGDRETVYVSKNAPDDILIASQLFTEKTGAIQILLLLGIPGIIIIFMPKPFVLQINEKNKYKNNGEK